ncbi:MAG: pseudouridine synthase, partial [Candidatus Margulisiibacteriota bacterium]
MLTRLQKYLADCGVASRRAAEKLITSGQVKVNGQVVAILGAKVDQEKDKVEYRGQVVSPQPRHIYIILNKPVGYLSACSAKKGEKTVLDLVKVPERIFPVGRLDKDSEGLLLLTNDGEFAHKLMHPSFEHEKEYVVAVHEKVSPRQISHLRDGVLLEDGKTYPARVKQLGAKEFSV